tara:strand:+ start:1375 stop:1869 length:495 start_codon:yes stop_codon:yes gene_type:complete
MKNLFLSVIAFFAFTLIAQAQAGLNLGMSYGFPSGNDMSAFYDSSLTIDGSYLTSVSEKIDAGLASGFHTSFGKKAIPDFQFIPIAAAGRLGLTKRIVLGGDLGYAIGLNDGNDGGFYYRPMVGFTLLRIFQLNASYVGVSVKNFSYGTFNIGASINLFGNRGE